MESDHRNPGGDRKGIWIKELFEQLRLLFMFQQSEMISTPYPGLVTRSIFVLLPFGKKNHPLTPSKTAQINLDPLQC